MTIHRLNKASSRALHDTHLKEASEHTASPACNAAGMPSHRLGAKPNIALVVQEAALWSRPAAPPHVRLRRLLRVFFWWRTCAVACCSSFSNSGAAARYGIDRPRRIGRLMLQATTRYSASAVSVRWTSPSGMDSVRQPFFKQTGWTRKRCQDKELPSLFERLPFDAGLTATPIFWAVFWLILLVSITGTPFLLTGTPAALIEILFL